ncbi:DUF2892 domain-containing protein [Candidatus Neomarinimicrobiota bacterium]
MKINMGSVDRIIRVILAVVFGVLILLGIVKGVLAWILGILGVIFLVTSLLSRCPLYLPLGISTMKKTTGGESS